MATTSNTGSSKPATTKTTVRKRPTQASARRTTASARKTATSARATAGNARRTTRAASKTAANSTATRVEQVQQLAERAVLVQVGAGLLVRDNLVSTVTGLSDRLSSRASVERELKKAERRGASARNQLERQVRRARTQLERELRQRRATVERTVKQNRRSLEREVRTLRNELQRDPAGTVTTRVSKLVNEAQGIIS